MTLWEVAAELSRRLTRIFLQGRRRPPAGARQRIALYRDDPHWRDLVLFYEYFHGDNGAGVGRQPPDRLDRPGREAAAAERRGSSMD